MASKSGNDGGLATHLTSYKWEMGPELEMAEKWLAKWPAAIFRGRAPKWMKNGRANGRIAACPAIRPAIFSAILGPPRKIAASHFASHFSAIYPFPTCSSSVAGQVGRNKRPRNQGLKKSAEIRHRSSASLCLHRCTVQQVFSDNFLNPRLPGLLSLS